MTITKYLFIFTILLSLHISCNKSDTEHSAINNSNDKEPKSEEHIRSVDAYYIIKLNKSQIKILGRTRKITLTNNQAKVIKNKIKSFSVGGPYSRLPEGWFHAIWYKPDGIKINKGIIRNFDDLVDESMFPKSEGIIFNIIIDLNGIFYCKNKAMSINQIISSINNCKNKYKKTEISIHISKAPFIDSNISTKVDENINTLKGYAKSSEIYLQDDF